MAQIIKADLNEMVFEGRDRAYGAYPLRKGYPRALFYAVVTAVAVFLIFSFAQIIANTFFAGDPEDARKAITVKMSMEDLPPPPTLPKE